MTEGRLRFESLSENISRSLATRIPRRSLLATLGKGGMAMALVGSGAQLAFDASDADASHASCPCGSSCSNSNTCLEYWGTNDCPPSTFGCGWWTVCAPPCTYRKVWSDCCNDVCAVGCNNGSPYCYWHKTYACGSGTCTSRVACRRWYCTSGGPCNTRGMG
jgi:hypothetical protein